MLFFGKFGMLRRCNLSHNITFLSAYLLCMMNLFYCNPSLFVFSFLRVYGIVGDLVHVFCLILQEQINNASLPCVSHMISKML